MQNKYKMFDDKELIRLFKSSKKEAEAAFTELYNRYSSSVHAYCMRVLDNEEQAEDVFQETFIKFYNNVSAEAKDFNVPGFLITIARNLCLNCKRDRKNTVAIEDMEYLIHETPSYEKKELLDLITRSLDLLEEEMREAFVLREYSGLSYEEIAKATKSSVANAKTRVFRAKQKIKTILQPYLKDLAQ